MFNIKQELRKYKYLEREKMAKKYNTKKRKKQRRVKIIAIILLIVIIVGLAVLIYPSYKNANSAISELEDIKYKFDELIVDEITNDIPKFNYQSKYWKYFFSSADDKYVNSDGKVTRPTYSEGNKEITLYLDLELTNVSAIDKIVFNILGVTNQKIDDSAVIIKLPQSNKETIEEVYKLLVLPETVYASINLPLSLTTVKDLSLTWESDNESIMTKEGNLVKDGSLNKEGTVKLTCNMILGNEVKTKIFNINVRNNLIINEYNLSFDDYKDSSYSETSYEGLTLINSLSENEKIKLKSTSDGEDVDGTIITELVKSSKKISFTYKYAKEETYTKASFVVLSKSNDLNVWEEVKKEKLMDNEEHTFTCELSGDYYYKITFTTEYSEKMFYLDDLKIDRGITEIDIIKSLDLPNTVKENIDLPFTTIYGGKVKYDSSSSSLTSIGVCTRKDEAEKVTLTVKIDEFGVEFTHELTVLGLNERIPVEIRFIDVGKYGASDCGESILIKYQDYEILIDAGDRFDATVTAITEVIDKYSEDKILEYIIATHPDSDHIGSMDDVIEKYKVNNIITFMGTASSGVYNDYIDAVNNEDADVCTVLDSYNNANGCKRVITIGEDVTLEIINTQNYEQDENNARSIVCVLDAYGVRTLFTGDADNNSSELEKAYMNTVGDIDILKMVHHGTREGTTTEFLEAVDPETVIICSGNYFGNKHGHPTYEALGRVYDYDENIKMYAVVGGEVDNCVVENSGSFTCESEGEERFYQRNGTITITINGTDSYSVSSEYNNGVPIEIKDTDFWNEVKDLNK